MHRPRLAGQICIVRIYLSMGVSPEEISSFNGRERLEFLARHGTEVSRMVAYTLCRGPVSRRLLVRPVAWFLREAVEHRFLMGALEKFISLMGSESFTSIISSIDRANPMKLRMSQGRKGSKGPSLKVPIAPSVLSGTSRAPPAGLLSTSWRR